MQLGIAGRVILAAALVACASVTVRAAGAEAVQTTQDLAGVEHHWVRDQMAYRPYTEPAVAERDAEAAAVAALDDPQRLIELRGTHDYQEAAPFVALVESLRSAEPRVVGHELLIWNGDRAARVYVSSEGLIKLLDSGTPRQIIPTSSSLALTDAGDLDAYEIARRAMSAASGLEPGVSDPVGGLVTAHAVGFAADDGSHVVTRVDVDENVSFPDW